jgi:hypothetical protein
MGHEQVAINPIYTALDFSQLLTCWYGFLYTYPKCEIYGL